MFRSQEPSGALEGLLLPDNLTMPNRELLLVEDDVTQSEVLAELLQSAGFALDSVQTCRGARARLERNTYDASPIKIFPMEKGLRSWLTHVGCTRTFHFLC